MRLHRRLHVRLQPLQRIRGRHGLHAHHVDAFLMGSSKLPIKEGGDLPNG